MLIADLCVDEYTITATAGSSTTTATVDNDATLEIYAKEAVAQAEAGADMIAPSGMMDGQVGAMRAALDTNGFDEHGDLGLLGQVRAALYGPFRDAVDVAISAAANARIPTGLANAREALGEVRADVAEGADM